MVIEFGRVVYCGSVTELGVCVLVGGVLGWARWGRDAANGYREAC